MYMHIHYFATIVLAYLLQQATRDQTLPPPFFPPTGHTFIPALLVVHSRQASRRNLELVRFFYAQVLRIVVQPGRCTTSMAIETVTLQFMFNVGRTETLNRSTVIAKRPDWNSAESCPLLNKGQGWG
jgi:hypothetical protein